MKEILKKHQYFLLFFFSFYAGLVCYSFFNFSTPIFLVVFGFPFLIGGFYLSIKNFHVLFSIMVLSLPISINQSKVGGDGFGISMPGELIVVFVAGVGIFHVMWNWGRFKDVFSHWLTFFVILHLIWMGVTTITSVMTLVSVKFFIIRSIYVMVFFLLAIDYFKENSNVIRFYWVYFLSMVIPILYSIDYHSQHDFSQAFSYEVGDPFYNDHTIYAACLAMLIPFFIMLIVRYSEIEKRQYQLFAGGALALMIVAILLSYSRAGWLSLTVALVCFIAIKMGIRFYQVALLFGIITMGLYINGDKIIDKVKENDTESSEGFLNHARSVANISTDNSNIERLNRWVCALRMFEEKPVVGFGPGTYPFQYGQFQLSQEMTWVSVRDGSVGGVHSEYLKPLSEMGLLGFMFFMVIIIGTLKIGLDLIQDKNRQKDKSLILGIYLGFITYLIHGIVNFFLDTDKASVLFWGAVAAVVAYDLQRKRVLEDKEKIELN